MRRTVLLLGFVAGVCLTAGHASAQPGNGTPANGGAPESEEEPELTPEERAEEERRRQAKLAEEERKRQTAIAEAEQLYERYLRHRLPRRATAIIDTALDLAALRQALPEMWDAVRRDPTLNLAWTQLKILYKPRLAWSAYAGALAESTRYAGLTAGASLDVEAPLCRYVGAAVNSHGYHQGGQGAASESGLAYDTRLTGCLPWGPFAFELGVLRQRDNRVGLQSAPSMPSTRFHSDGFEMRIRGFRYFADDWELIVQPTDVVYRKYSAVGDSTIPTSANFEVSSTFVRYIGYGTGFLGADKVVDSIAVDVVGQEETQVQRLSTTVMRVSPFELTNAQLSDGLYLDGHIALLSTRIVSLDDTENPLYERFHFGTQVQLHMGNEDVQGSFRYQRRILPDSEFRLIAEDRLDATAQVVRDGHDTSLGVYGALNRQRGAPPGVLRLPKEATYGLVAKHGRYLHGPFYLQLTTTGARSYYATPGSARLLTPALEFRALASIIASIGSQ